ncbi:hypothetical protein Y032_0085g1867 [Ancylostoma ceylanicum]|uniref:Elongator complex protein 2 n=2 Tax=Ancylostoma ceylanicum TaxID=53326 RepID=A0A016TQB7_9BILA|nr:hypothetical protein Y032_0085g1867 [Ancylostoma ceylanicum]
MVELTIKEMFTAAGINPRSHCLSACRESNQFVFASDDQLVLQTFPEPSHGLVQAISERHHEGQITILKRVTSIRQHTHGQTISTDLFVAGSADGKVVLYEVSASASLIRHLLTLDNLKGSIGALCGTLSGPELVVVASWVSDGNSGVRVWWLSCEPHFSVRHSYDIPEFGNVFALAVDMQNTKNDRKLLALGTTKRTIEFYCETPCGKAVKPVLSIAGHEDWIHSLAFNQSTPILLASASQDTQVKLWRIEETVELEDSSEISVAKNCFTVEGVNPEESPLSLSIGVESVLTGHDDWVQSVEWDREGRTIITSSSDKSVIIWKETHEGLWTDTVRLGIVGGQAAGFYCAVFSPDAKQIVASSYFGGLYAWIAPKTEEDSWSAAAVCSGHFGAVRDLAWHPDGKFVISVGEDKTTRVYVSPKNETYYVEVGRPQVHGHSMQCIAVVSGSIIVTGAEEKIFRAFEAPQTFVKSVCNIGGFEVKEVFRDYVPAYYGARVPALGLSNKAVEDSQEVLPEENGDAHWEEGAFQASPAELFAPPTEDCLQQNTLWPEIHKLYGHGYEVYAIAANPTGTVLATSCKASQAEDAVVVLWDTSDWSKKSEISGHQLTVTQIEWSPDGKLLLSVSRDRKVILYREQDGNVNGFSYEKFWSSEKEHSRIIWSCCWLCDSRHFVTSSRDMQVILWECSNSGAVASSKIKCPQPATSVAVGCGEQMTESIVAVGLQNGSILLLSIGDGNQLEIVRQLFVPPVNVDRAILRLRFNPVDRKTLAVAGSDGKLRILKIELIKSR